MDNYTSMAYHQDLKGSPPLVLATESNSDPEWSPGLDPQDLRDLQEAQRDPTKIAVKLPKESARLGYFSTLCLISNRLIGSGVFNSAQVVFPNTQSIGLALVLWVGGAIFALAGTIVYIELGLTIPRWPIGASGEKISTPRSGDTLNYFNYMLRRPVFLATCLFGIAFIILENSAHNAIALGQNILMAAQVNVTPGKVLAIGLSATTFCCFLHALSRKWGIILNNVFGTVKFLILVFIILIGLIWIDRDVARKNFDVSTSFETPRAGPYRFAEAVLFVIFPYGAFHQVNYVISELDQPRKIFPRASFYGILLIAIMFTATNFIYAAIIPKEKLFALPAIDVGAEFIARTLGRAGLTSSQQITLWNILKAISALGNLIVTTFTAARVKQEIAKEGILPYSLVFVQSYDISFKSLFRRKPSLSSKSDTFTSENTPVATLILHWVITNIMVIIPILLFRSETPYVPTPAYTFLVGIVVYVTNVVKFTLIALGLLYLRLSPSARWAEKSQFKHPVISIIAATALLVICVFPLIFIWVPDRAYTRFSRTYGLVSWFVLQTIGLGILGLAFLYWVGFRSYIWVRSNRQGKTLHVKREPKFRMDSGGLVQIAEIVTLQWVRDVGMRLDDIDEAGDGRQHLREESERRASSKVHFHGARDRQAEHYYARVPPELNEQHGVSELGINDSYVRNRSPRLTRHEMGNSESKS